MADQQRNQGTGQNQQGMGQNQPETGKPGFGEGTQADQANQQGQQRQQTDKGMGQGQQGTTQNRPASTPDKQPGQGNR
jgi:hypothetical protein